MIQQATLEQASIPSAHNPDKRFHPQWDGSNWTCDCEHYRRYKTPCRHILQVKLENARHQPRTFNGPSFDVVADEIRLTKQLARIFSFIVDSEWKTLQEIQQETGDPQASISAQLRHLRKKRYGANTVDKRRRGDDAQGLWEYRLIVNDKCKIEVVKDE